MPLPIDRRSAGPGTSGRLVGRDHGTVLAAYQQPVSDAIGSVVTALVFGVASLAFFTDFGGVRSNLAQRVADQSRRPPYRWFLLTRSARERNADAARIDRLYRGMALFSLGVACVLLTLEVVALLVNGLR